MRAFAVAAVSSLGLFASFTVQAEDARAAPPQTLEAIALNEPNRIVCAYLYHDGTVIRRPICRTAQAWLSEHQRTRREILEYQLGFLTHGR
jgi:hypothetical protein